MLVKGSSNDSRLSCGTPSADRPSGFEGCGCQYTELVSISTAEHTVWSHYMLSVCASWLASC